MIKLVNQFDDEKSKISLATPTCGCCCCCCCCCCIVSTIAVPSITARNFGKFFDDDIERPDKEKRYSGKAMFFGFFAPIVTALLVLFVYLVIYSLIESSSYMQASRNPLDSWNEHFAYIGQLELEAALKYFIGVIFCVAFLILTYRILGKYKNKIKGLISRVIISTITLAAAMIMEAIIVLMVMGFISDNFNKDAWNSQWLWTIYIIVAIIIDIILLVKMFQSKNKIMEK